MSKERLEDICEVTMEQCRKIVRRKAKRIERASERLSYLKFDIKNSPFIRDDEKKSLLWRIEDIEPYLKNDDFEENKYNYDNANN